MDISVNLPPDLISFMKARVDSGRYEWPGEGVREALRLLERCDGAEAAALERLRQAWADGIASGDAGPVDGAALKSEGRRRLATPPKP
jgi:antitoxin ParD1/3/4